MLTTLARPCANLVRFPFNARSARESRCKAVLAAQRRVLHPQEISVSMKSLVPAGFDYSGLTAAAREMAERTAEKIRQHQRRTSAEIIDIGTDLIRVKAALGHGHFEA